MTETNQVVRKSSIFVFVIVIFVSLLHSSFDDTCVFDGNIKDIKHQSNLICLQILRSIYFDKHPSDALRICKLLWVFLFKDTKGMLARRKVYHDT